MQDQAASSAHSAETISQEQLDAMAQLHKRFLTGRLGGRRAMLKNTNMHGLSLRGHDLKQANFIGCTMTANGSLGGQFSGSLLVCL